MGVPYRLGNFEGLEDLLKRVSPVILTESSLISFPFVFSVPVGSECSAIHDFIETVMAMV